MDFGTRDSAGAIVVGVDGSAGGRRALEWALQEAKLRGLGVRAIGIAQIHLVALSVPGYPYADERYINDLVDSVKKMVADQVQAANQEHSVEVTVEAVMGAPADVLLEASKGAEMLVVGSRGHGGFTGLLLGSVSHQCVSHAWGPVAVIRDRKS
ncbi:MAG: universal stress protein [Candidatus Dormibacteria bacterium]